MTRPRENATEAPRDVRPTVRPRVVEEMLLAASEGAMGRFLEATADKRWPRFPEPPSWPQLRAFFHAMGDVDRRAAILRLLGEETGRLRTDRGADLHRGGA